MTGDRSSLLARIADETMANGGKLPSLRDFPASGMTGLRAEMYPPGQPREIRFRADWPDGYWAEEWRSLDGYGLLGGLHREPVPKPGRLPAFSRFMVRFNTALAAGLWIFAGTVARHDWTVLLAPLAVSAGVAMHWIGIRKIYGRQRRASQPARRVHIPMSKLWIAWAVLAAVIVLLVLR